LPGPNNPLIPDPDEEKDLPLQPMDTTGSDFYKSQQEERQGAFEAEKERKREEYIAGLNPAQQESLFKRRPELRTGGEQEGGIPPSTGASSATPPAGPVASGGSQQDVQLLEELRLIRQLLQTIDSNIQSMESNGIAVTF